MKRNLHTIYPSQWFFTQCHGWWAATHSTPHTHTLNTYSSAPSYPLCYQHIQPSFPSQWKHHSFTYSLFAKETQQVEWKWCKVTKSDVSSKSLENNIVCHTQTEKKNMHSKKFLMAGILACCLPIFSKEHLYMRQEMASKRYCRELVTT